MLVLQSCASQITNTALPNELEQPLYRRLEPCTDYEQLFFSDLIATDDSVLVFLDSNLNGTQVTEIIYVDSAKECMYSFSRLIDTWVINYHFWHVNDNELIVTYEAGIRSMNCADINRNTEVDMALFPRFVYRKVE